MEFGVVENSEQQNRNPTPYTHAGKFLGAVIAGTRHERYALELAATSRNKNKSKRPKRRIQKDIRIKQEDFDLSSDHSTEPQISPSNNSTPPGSFFQLFSLTSFFPHSLKPCQSSQPLEAKLLDTNADIIYPPQVAAVGINPGIVLPELLKRDTSARVDAPAAVAALELEAIVSHEPLEATL